MSRTALGSGSTCQRQMPTLPLSRISSAWVCAGRTVGNFDGNTGLGGLGCLLARQSPVAKTAVFLSSRSAPFNFVLAPTFVGAKTRSQRNPFF